MTAFLDSYEADIVAEVAFNRLNHFCAPVSVDRGSSEVTAFLQDPSHKIRILGIDCPNPIFSFDEALLPPELMRVVDANGWLGPTPIQAVSLPIALRGRDMIGIAKTGSGKTGAFAIPAVLHVMQNRCPGSRGPYALVISPTRELAQQIYQVLAQFAQAMNLRTVCLYGGERTRRDQGRQCQGGPEIVIATPGRLLDFTKAHDLSLSNVSFLVVDEADNLLTMGFQGQLRIILRCCQPGRHMLMWSATWPREVRDLADEFLGKGRILVVVGANERTVNQSIEQQIIEVDDWTKFDTLMRVLEDLHDESHGRMKVILFTNTKKRVSELAARLTGWRNMAIYKLNGDMSQAERDISVERFRKTRGNCCLVATAVAQRGMNVEDVSHVVLYDMPDDIDDYVHRIGRTARAHRTGKSIALFSRKRDSALSRKLVKVLNQGQQPVPDWLNELAEETHVEAYRELRSRRSRY